MSTTKYDQVQGQVRYSSRFRTHCQRFYWLLVILSVATCTVPPKFDFAEVRYRLCTSKVRVG